MITIDASVLVAAGSPDDPARPDSAAIARRTGDERLAMEAGAALLSIPGLVLHPLGLEASADASALAARLHLRAADAVYAATAARQETTLVTLDDDLLARSAPVVDAVTPTEWLARRR
jgi:predicted nucleic acid-binding protein